MKKVTILVFTVLLSITLICRIFFANSADISQDNNIENNISENIIENTILDVVLNDDAVKIVREIDDWRLVLVNSEHQLPIDYELNIVNLDKNRQVDSRIVDELNSMLEDMKKSKINNIWVQSGYRSIEHQEEVYNNSITKYLEEGKTLEEAEELTLRVINKPGTSEHNLGLAIDLNYVNYDFDKTQAFKWLQENAENYGFILRYRQDKEDITKVDYEPWHWRYVGVEHAKKINEFDMCLEEYIEYLTTK